MVAGQTIYISAWICLSIVSSTSLILLLKLVKFRLNCKYTTTLSTFHFLATWILLEIFAFFGAVRRCDQVTFRHRFTLAFLVMTSIVSMNFNLAANSIGFYQMSKLCTIPYMIVYNLVRRRQRYAAGEYVSLGVLLIGVGMFSISDVEVNALGTIYAVIAVMSTAHNQMITGDLQREYQITGPELQLALLPEEFSLGVVSATALENIGPGSFALAKFALTEMALMLATCVFAIGVNVSTFQLIGKTSSITYQVIGHAKTVLLLVFGYLFFPSPWESTEQQVRAMMGIVLALFGVLMYTKVRIDLEAKKKAAAADPERQPLLAKDEAK
jgi:solute carrier family 35 protein E3